MTNPYGPDYDTGDYDLPDWRDVASSSANVETTDERIAGPYRRDAYRFA